MIDGDDVPSLVPAPTTIQRNTSSRRGEKTNQLSTRASRSKRVLSLTKDGGNRKLYAPHAAASPLGAAVPDNSATKPTSAAAKPAKRQRQAAAGAVQGLSTRSASCNSNGENAPTQIGVDGIAMGVAGGSRTIVCRFPSSSGVSVSESKSTRTYGATAIIPHVARSTPKKAGRGSSSDGASDRASDSRPSPATGRYARCPPTSRSSSSSIDLGLGLGGSSIDLGCSGGSNITKQLAFGKSVAPSSFASSTRSASTISEGGSGIEVDEDGGASIVDPREWWMQEEDTMSTQIHGGKTPNLGNTVSNRSEWSVPLMSVASAQLNSIDVLS